MQYAALLLLALLQVVLAIVLSYKRRSRVSRTFAIFAVCLAVWTLFNVLLDYYQYHGQGSAQLLAALNKLAFLTGTLALICVYRLTLVFPMEKKLTKRTRTITIAGIVLAGLSLLPPVSGGFVYDTPGQPATYTYGSLVFLVGLYSLLLVALCVANIAGALRKNINRHVKRQATSLFVALILTVAHAIIFITVIPAIAPSQERIVFVGYFAPFIFTAAMLYSIFAQRFLDFRLIIARSMTYIMSLAFLGLAYGLTVFVVLDKWLLDPFTTSQSQQRAVFIILALLFGLSFAPAKRVFDRLSNRIFYRDAYDPQAFIDSLTGVLVSNTDIAKLLRESSDLISRHLKPNFVDFVLTDERYKGSRQVGRVADGLSKDQLEDLQAKIAAQPDSVIEVDDSQGQKSGLSRLGKKDIAVVIKLSSHENLLGIVLLGAKRSGNAYNGQDKEVFEIMADGLSLALENSLSYEKIQKFSETLQQEVDDATRRLRFTNAKLKALDETKDEFISMASHQLRTPLTSVKGYLSMVLDGDVGELNDQQKKMLAQAFASSQRMNYLITDLLNVSRLRTGKFVIEKGPVYLPDIAGDEIDQLRELARAKNIELTYDKPAEFPTLQLDETKTRQVIMNFIDNALHYTPEGGKVRVELEAQRRTVELRVIDNGMGVPKREQHKLFEKFYRAGNARRTRPDGTGLGLFMAKKVIIAQGGAVIFKSTEGKGSTFGFTFPLKSKAK